MKYKNDRSVFHKKTFALPDGGKLPLLTFELLEQVPGIRHCFTTRAGGVSEGMFESLNLSFTRGDDPAAVLENYQRVAEAMGSDTEHIVTSDQTHTVNVRRVKAEDAGKGIVKPRDYQDVDGLITDIPGLILATFYADCVPLYFVDPVRGAIGLSHSGWRGTVKRMGEATIKAMGEAFGTKAYDLICAIGPSICQDCYQVDEDVAEAFRMEFGDQAKTLLRPEGGGKYRLDLWEANRLVLLEAGVLPEKITVTNLCTCCNPKQLFSHRASGGKRGNLGAFLMLENR